MSIIVRYAAFWARPPGFAVPGKGQFVQGMDKKGLANSGKYAILNFRNERERTEKEVAGWTNIRF